MNKRLNTKIQKISARMPEMAKVFSSILTIPPDDDEALEKKGELYCVFDISSDQDLDTLLVAKIVNDVLHDAYYRSENASPMQALEKAIIEVRDNVTKLSKSKSGNVTFNIIGGALWGNVLYIVQYGKGGSFLMRDNGVKLINSATEGNFTVASGVVKDEDVVVLGTSVFVEKFPPESLLSSTSPVSLDLLPQGASAFILKFIVDKSFSDAEVIDFGNKVPLVKKERLGIKIKPKLGTKAGPILLITLLVGAVLAVSLFLTSKKNDKSKVPAKKTEVVKNKDVAVEKKPEVKAKEGTDYPVFYDIKVTDVKAQLTEITVLDGLVVVTDKTSGKIFTSTFETPKFTEAGTTFLGISQPHYFENNIGFYDKEGYKVYDVKNNKVKESYTQAGFDAVSTYLDFVYSVSGDTLTKFEKGKSVLSATVWAKTTEFNGVNSIAIDSSIYLLKSDGNLLKYTRGVKDAFKISGLEKPLSSPNQIFTDADMKNIYVADKGNKRIVVLGKDEKFVKQYLHSKDNGWDDLKGIGVSGDEKKMFVLNGSSVYEVDL